MDSFSSLLWQAMAIDRHIISPNPSWLAMAIDGRGWRSIFFDDVYQSTVSPIYCRQQYLSMDTFHNLLSSTISTNRLPPSSIAVVIDHCCVYCPGCHDRYITILRTITIIRIGGGVVWEERSSYTRKNILPTLPPLYTGYNTSAQHT